MRAKPGSAASTFARYTLLNWQPSLAESIAKKFAERESSHHRAGVCFGRDSTSNAPRNGENGQQRKPALGSTDSK
jgi:hypothetical protein